jgi:hypothetical protein
VHQPRKCSFTWADVRQLEKAGREHLAGLAGRAVHLARVVEHHRAGDKVMQAAAFFASPPGALADAEGNQAMLVMAANTPACLRVAVARLAVTVEDKSGAALVWVLPSHRDHSAVAGRRDEATGSRNDGARQD